MGEPQNVILTLVNCVEAKPVGIVFGSGKNSVLSIKQKNSRMNEIYIYFLFMIMKYTFFLHHWNVSGSQ